MCQSQEEHTDGLTELIMLIMDNINAFQQSLWSVIQAQVHPLNLRKRAHRACNGEEVKETLMPWVPGFSKVVSALWVFDHIFRMSLNLQRVILLSKKSRLVPLPKTWHPSGTDITCHDGHRGTHPGPALAQFVYQSRFRVGNVLPSLINPSKHTWMSQWAHYKSWRKPVRVAAAPVMFYFCFYSCGF